MLPLYWADKVAALGVAKVALAWPLYAAAVPHGADPGARALPWTPRPTATDSPEVEVPLSAGSSGSSIDSMPSSESGAVRNSSSSCASRASSGLGAMGWSSRMMLTSAVSGRQQRRRPACRRTVSFRAV